MKKWLCIAVLLTGCKSDKLGVSEYRYWLNQSDNGLFVKRELEDFKISTVYKPIDWLVLKNLEDFKLDHNKSDSVRKEIGGLQYFGLKMVNKQFPDILKYKIKEGKTYEQNFNYFTGSMKNDIYLVDGNDTLPCILFHYEHNYGASPVNVFNLAFKRLDKEAKEGKDLVFDAQYMGLGILKFHYSKEDIDNIPTLILN